MSGRREGKTGTEPLSRRARGTGLSGKWALSLFSLLLATTAHAQVQPRSVLIENFESGVKAWKTNDGLAGERGKPTIAAIYAVSPGAPQTGGTQAGLIEFAAGEKTWASVTLAVEGALWADTGCTGLALWVRGSGERQTALLVLRSYTKSGGVTTDTSYTCPLSLASAQWSRVTLPFASFKDDHGRPIDEPHLRAVKLLQFVETGSWPGVRFAVDDLRAEVLAIAPAEPPAQPQAAGATRALLMDFDKGGRDSRLQQGVCLGSDAWKALADRAFAGKVKSNLASLGRAVVRVKLSDFYERDLGQLNTLKLQNMLAWIRFCGCDPLLCLDEPLPIAGVSPEQGWRGFGALCAHVVGLCRKNPGPHLYEIGSDPLIPGQFRSIEAATDLYDGLAAQVLLTDPTARVGGLGFGSAWDEHLRYFIAHARTLHFLTLHFYGAHNPVASNETLFRVACSGRAEDLPNQLSLADIRELLQRRSGPEPQLWVTECGLNSAREANGQARDARLRSASAAAWMTALTLSIAPYVDRVLWFKAFGHGWGLLNDDGSPGPGLYAAQLLARFVPPSATVGETMLAGEQVLLAPVSAAAGRYAVIANSARSARLEVELRGTPPLPPVRLRRFDAATPTPAFEPLSASMRQKLTLTGPGLAIIEAPAVR